MHNFVKTEKQDFGIATVSISRPEALNALNHQILMELRATFETLAHDDSVRVIVLRGAGDKAFVAGGDILEMQHMDRGQAATFARLGHSICFLIESVPKVVIAAVHGFALGGGTELALSCDFIMASDKAVFGLPEVTLGVIPGFGGTIRLSRTIGTAKAKELIFSGVKVKAEEAKTLGLIRAVYPQDQFFNEVYAMAKKISQNSLSAVLAAKRLLNEFEEADGTQFKTDAEVHLFGGLFGEHDQKEGMVAFSEKRPAKFKGL